MQEWARARVFLRAGFGQAALIVGLVLGGLPGRANASETYPAQVQLTMSKRLNTSYCVPQCILCHRTNLGGRKTMNVFGLSMEHNVDLGPAVPGTVGAKLEKYFAEHADLDSDGDGVTDVKEIEVGDSPAIPGAAGENLICPDITYGCGARIAPQPSSGGLEPAAVIALGLGLFSARRRRGRFARAAGLPLK